MAGANTVSVACIQAVPTSYLPMVRFRSSRLVLTLRFTPLHQPLMKVKRPLALAQITNFFWYEESYA